MTDSPKSLPASSDDHDHAHQPFWKTKTMAEMSPTEWESLCDGCGKCCLLRLEDEDTAAIYVTDVACKLFDAGTCQCTNYDNRRDYVPDCVQLTPDNVSSLTWMPQTCAYRLIANGQDLPHYHYLISGSKDTIHTVGMSVQNAAINEADINEDDIPKRIVIWPGEPDVLG